MNGRSISIHTTRDPLEAEFLKSYLVTNGLHATLSNERPGWTGRYSAMSRGVRLLVPEAEVKRAKQLLKEAEAGAFALSEEELIRFAETGDGTPPDAPYVPLECPNCGSSSIVKNARRGLLFALLNVLLLGLPWLVTPTTWACSECGWEWSRAEVREEREE